MFRKYSLGWVLVILALLSWLGQYWTHDFSDGGWQKFWNATFENWQSEFIQLFAFVVLAKFLRFRGSPQSRDDEEDTKDALARLERGTGRLYDRMEAMERVLHFLEKSDQERRAAMQAGRVPNPPRNHDRDHHGIRQTDEEQAGSRPGRQVDTVPPKPKGMRGRLGF